MNKLFGEVYQNSLITSHSAVINYWILYFLGSWIVSICIWLVASGKFWLWIFNTPWFGVPLHWDPKQQQSVAFFSGAQFQQPQQFIVQFQWMVCLRLCRPKRNHFRKPGDPYSLYKMNAPILCACPTGFNILTSTEETCGSAPNAPFLYIHGLFP